MSDEATTETTETTESTETTETTMAPQSFIDGEGNFTEGWEDRYLTEDIRNDGTFKEGRIKNVQGLFKSLASAERMIGKEKIAMPSDSSSDEEWDAFHRAGGWTGEPLPFNAPEGLSEELWSEERATKFSEKFNELKLNPKQVAGLIEAYNADIMQQVSDQNNNSETAMAKLKTELLAEKGNSYTQFEHNGNIAIEKGIDSPEHKQRVLDKFANDSDFIRMMGNLGANFAEAGGIPSVRMAPTPSDINAKIVDVRTSDAYNQKKNPGHQAAMDTLARLYEERDKIKQPA